jgi:hypothetical protein
LIKTGHIIPINAGHNGPLNKTEITLYEIHLTNAGFIIDFNSDTERALMDDVYDDEDEELTGEPEDEEQILAGFQDELDQDDLVEEADF